MGFRDHDESRRAKVDALLAQREEHEERIGALEERLKNLETRLEAQEETQSETKGPSKSKAKSRTEAKAKPKKELDAADVFQRRWRAIFITAGVFIVGCFFLMYRGIASSAPEADAVEQTTQSRPAPTPSPPARTAEWDGTGEVDLEELLESLNGQAPQPPTDRPIFTGHVSLATSGASVEEGAPCEVRIGGPERLLSLLPPESLEIRCGGETLYSIGSAPPCSVRGQGEIFGGLFTFACDDRGIREDRPEMELSSVDHHLRIWSEAENWMVTLVLDRAAARVALSRRLDEGPGLPLTSPHSLSLRVQEHQGEGGPGDDTTLTLTMSEPESADANCAFTLREGRRVVGQSEGRCLFDAQLALIGVDAGLTEERRFGLTMDLREERVSIESADSERSWAAQATIETSAE